MNRRNFLRTSALGVLFASSPISFSAMGEPTRQTTKGGKLNLSFRPYELKLKHAFNLAKNQRTSTPGVQVQLEYDGLVGYGEASMPPYLGESVDSVCTFLSKLDLSQFSDPFRIEDILAYRDSIDDNNRAAKASVDIALYDLLGKIMGQPWYKIWGLNPEKIPNTSYTISYQSDPEEMQKEIDECADFKVVKVKMGVGHDKEIVEELRKSTDVPICVDANQGWNSKEHALEMCQWLADKNCLFVEQPMPKEMYEETAWVTERSPVPIMADEFCQRLPDVMRAKDAYHGINIKLMKSTGLHEAYKMATLAKGLGMKVMLGCMTETSCGISAAAQLSPMVDWVDLDGNMLIANDIFDGARLKDGKMMPTDLPGIGCTPMA